MKTCSTCQSPLTLARTSWLFTESGLDDVLLEGVEVYACNGCGHETVVIPKLGSLHATLAAVLSAKDGPLDPKERRFLRSYLGWSRAEFADEVAALFGPGVSTDETGAFDPRAERYLRRAVDAGWRLTAYPDMPAPWHHPPVLRYAADTSRWNFRQAA